MKRFVVCRSGMYVLTLPPHKAALGPMFAETPESQSRLQPRPSLLADNPGPDTAGTQLSPSPRPVPAPTLPRLAG